jgi:hypothetical protein
MKGFLIGLLALLIFTLIIIVGEYQPTERVLAGLLLLAIVCALVRGLWSWLQEMITIARGWAGSPEWLKRERLKAFWIYFLAALLLFVLPGAAYLYQSATPTHVINVLDASDPGAWLVWFGMLFAGLMCVGTGYVMIKALRAWLREKSTELRAGSTTLWWVIADAILFLIAAWFFGSAGMRFISH